MGDLVSIRDLSKADVERLLHSAERMEKDLYNMHESHEGQMCATLFFEPSTRTHLSFQTAAQRLGMSVIPYSHEHSSSKKGETLTDTIKIVDGYADIIVIRHPMEGAARLAAEDDGAPFIAAARFIANGHSPYSRDKTYGVLASYCNRIARLAERRGVAMLSLEEQMPREGELPGRRDGHNLMVSKRLFIRSVLGYLPLIAGWQP